jgi:hypothetical protein
MEEKWMIEPGRGLGKIQFGISRAELINILDEPDAIDKNEEEGVSCEHYYYEDMDASFTFSEDEGDRLLIITTGNPAYSIAGKLHVGLSRGEATLIFRELEWNDPQIDTLSEPGNTSLIYAFEKLGLDIWFDDDVLSGFQMSPSWLDNGEIAWPSRN